MREDHMWNPNITQWMEISAAILMVVGLLGVFVHRITTRLGLGARAIQVIAVIEIIPTILILALEKVLSGETTSTLLGALIGYLLSGVANFKHKRTTSTSERRGGAKT